MTTAYDFENSPHWLVGTSNTVFINADEEIEIVASSNTQASVSVYRYVVDPEEMRQRFFLETATLSGDTLSAASTEATITFTKSGATLNFVVRLDGELEDDGGGTAVDPV